jgi:hypothetical protein
MIDAETIRKSLCNIFCTSINVNAVPCGFAISTLFADQSGDPLGFYVVEDSDGYRIEDDGEYLARLVGSGIAIDQGIRGQLLNAILAQGGASWDQDTFEIRSKGFSADKIGLHITNFLSSLIRVRDLELLTRDVIRSTFKEDVISALTESYGTIANMYENEAIDRSFSEFPADLIIRPKNPDSNKIGALYFVTSNEKLNEALLLQMEADRINRQDFKVIALIEDSEMRLISKKKFQRAQNRSLSMPIFRGDENAAVSRIGRELSLSSAA